MYSEVSKLTKKPMIEGMDALDQNEAWDLVKLPTRGKLVGIK
jgi:hypothetical protein